MPKNKKNILICIFSDWYSLYRVIVDMLNQNGYSVHILFLDTVPSLEVEEELRLKKIKYIVLINEYYYTKYKNILNSLLPYSRTSFGLYFLEQNTYFFLHYFYYFALDYLKKNNINLFIVNHDNFLHPEAAFLKAAKKLQIPILLPKLLYHFPFSFQYKQKEFHISSLDDPLYQKIIFKKFSSHKFGKQIYDDAFRYNSFVINAHYKFKTFSYMPHLPGGSDLVDKILILDQYHKDYLIEYGFDQNKLIVVGDLNYDNLYMAYQNKNNIKQKYNLENKKKKIIILALPQLFEHGYLNKKEAVEEINFLVKTASSIENISLFLSLHPSMNYLDYQYLEDEFNCHILKERLSDFLPIADLFIPTLSGTMIWSILLDIPLIAYNFYGWDTSNMYPFLNISYVQDKEDFQSVIEKTLNCSSTNFMAIHEKLSKNAVFDGKVNKRYLQNVEELILTYDEIQNNTVNDDFSSSFQFFNKVSQIHKFLLHSFLQYKLKDILKTKDYYLAPYNDLTINLQKYITKYFSSNCKGYIDQNKVDTNIVSFDKIENNPIVIIVSPNHYTSIKKNIKNNLPNAQIKILNKFKKYLV